MTVYLINSVITNSNNTITGISSISGDFPEAYNKNQLLHMKRKYNSSDIICSITLYFVQFSFTVLFILIKLALLYNICTQ